MNHVLSFSHRPKNFAFIFVGGPTAIATNHLFQRSKYYSISTAVSQLRLLQKASRTLAQVTDASPAPRWAHTRSPSFSLLRPEQ